MDDEIVLPLQLHPRAPRIFNHANITPDSYTYDIKASDRPSLKIDQEYTRTRVEGLEVARVRVARHGWLSPDAMPSLAGRLADPRARKEWSNRFTSIAVR